MAARKTTSKKAAEAQASVTPEVNAPTVENSTEELVAAASINVEIEENIADEADDDMGGLIFGDGGCLYIFIRKQDLAAGDFSQVRFSVQSH